MTEGGPPVSRPVPRAVAVETAFLTSGLPMDQRIPAVDRMADAIRGRRAAPAFIGVVGGRATIGLERDEIELLARQNRKLSTRDLPAAMARRWHGGTTVAATAFLAQRAGLDVVATGGIGGVHLGRGSAAAFDVSADLTELGRARVVVVCSGPKAIVDLPATLERLETLGVAVIGYGTEELPAFWSAASGLKLDTRADSAAEVAEIWRAAREIDAPGSLLVCVPPPPAVALTREEMERAVARALSDLENAGVTGPAVTPFLLAQIAEHTEGRSLEVNLALLASNAAVAAAIGSALEG